MRDPMDPSLLFRLAGVAATLSASCAHAFGEQRLSIIDPYFSVAAAVSVSADGTIALVWASAPGGRETGTWTSATGLGPTCEGTGWDLAGDATLRVGSTIWDFPVEPRASAWTACAADGVIPDDPGAPVGAPSIPRAATSVNADGTVVVGFGLAEMTDGSSGYAAFRRVTGGPALQVLPTPAASESIALGVSADGTKTVGEIRPLTSPLRISLNDPDPTWIWIFPPVEAESRAALWVGQNAPIILHDAIGTPLTARATTISDDGTVIGGVPQDTIGWPRAFRWTSAGKEQIIGPESAASLVRAASADGSVLVGRSSVVGGPVAFVWDAEHGYRDLNIVATSLGVDLNEVRLIDALDVSDDGLIICGMAQFQVNGYRLAFVLNTAPPSPPPPPPPPPPCPGDINGDYRTNVSDFNILAANFGLNPGATLAQGDLTGDGFVNAFDFNVLASWFGCTH